MIRSAAKKLHFIDLKSDGNKIQVSFNLANADEQFAKEFLKVTENIKRGDVIGAKGKIGRTKAGELTLFASSGMILTPCLHMIPDDYVGFTSKATRFKKR